MDPELAEKIAREALKRGAIRLNCRQAFLREKNEDREKEYWPIEINIETLLEDPDTAREMVADSIYKSILEFKALSTVDVVATILNKKQGSVPELFMAYSVAIALPAESYAIEESQDQKSISCLSFDTRTKQDIVGKKLVLITDCILNATVEQRLIKTIRSHGASCNLLLGVFDGNFNKASDNLYKLSPQVEFDSAFDYITVLNVALKSGIIKKQDMPSYLSFKSEPFSWSDKYKRGEFRKL